MSEVLALTASRLDAGAQIVVIESLKKRRRGQYRAVPIPPTLIDELRLVHNLGSLTPGNVAAERLWPWCRTTAWDRVKSVMAVAGVSGPQATPKGLRHAFAVASLQAGVPITLVRKWLGHTRLEMTERYTDLVGAEEQAIANRLWKTFRSDQDTRH